MSVPLGAAFGGGGPRPTELQLRQARIRARTTGESLAHVLAVFMGMGRHGADSGAPASGPEAPLADGPSGPSGPAGPTGPADQEADGSARLARVIPLSRARGSGGDGAAGDG